MKKILVLPAILIFISTSAFSMQAWKMRQWNKKMEKLLETKGEAAVLQEQRDLETALRQAVPDSKEAKLIRAKLDEIAKGKYSYME